MFKMHSLNFMNQLVTRTICINKTRKWKRAFRGNVYTQVVKKIIDSPHSHFLLLLSVDNFNSKSRLINVPK